jgi:hypothetical protein
LVRNPNGEEGLQAWRVFGNASVSDCSGAGKCFALHQDAFIFQDIDASEGATGMYALFISLASSERGPDQSNQKILGRPHMHGYFMTAGELRNAKLLANLAGQEMESRPEANGEWVKQFGVFRLPEQTGRIRIFLVSGCGKTEASSDCVSHFHKAGVFLFATEADAKAFAATYQ